MSSVLRVALLGFILGLAGLVVHPALSFADPALPSAQTHDDALKIPEGKFVQDLGDHVITIIADKKLNNDQRAEKFRQILRDAFDLKTIGRYVIGRTWNAATPAQQEEYMRLFEQLVVKNYGSQMTLYSGEGFKVVGVRGERENETAVTSQITHPDGSDPTGVDWRVRSKDGKLGIIDVVVEGVSLTVTQKQEYASVIQQNNGDIEGLLAVMRKQLTDPAPAPEQHG